MNRFKIEKGKEYSIRLMPDNHDMSNNIISLQYSIGKKKFRTTRYFSYIYINNRLECMTLTTSLMRYIENVIVGYYGTSEGYFIAGCDCNQPLEYYANNDKSLIILKEEQKEYEDEQLTKHTDIVLYEPINPFDITKPHILSFKTQETMGYLEIYNATIIEGNVLYHNGLDKSYISSLYNKPTLNDYIEQYKKELISHFIIFDD